MQVNGNHMALIEKYLDGAMSEAERSDFDLLLKQSPEFRNQLKEAQNTIAALKQHFDANLKAEMAAMYSDTVRMEKAGKRHYAYYWAAAAVLIFGLAGTWTYYSTRTGPEEKLFQAYYQVYPVKPATRDAKHEDDLAVSYYQDGEFAQALPLLLTDVQRYPDNDLLMLYVGNCYLNLRNYSAATTTFKKGALSEDEVVRQTSRWYLALSQLAALEVAESVGLLQDIVQGEELYAPSASALLQELNR